VRTLLIIVNCPDFFLSHRKELAIEAVNRGFEVVIATGDGDATREIVSLGFEHHHLRISRFNNSLVDEVLAAFDVFKLCRRLNPDLLHLVTLKPILYGGITARLLRLPAVIFAVAGLGSVFVGGTVRYKALRYLILWIFKFIFKHPNFKVIIQNSNDFKLFETCCNLRHDSMEMIKGSGVSLSIYKPSVKIKKSSTAVVLFAARLLKEKGILDFIEAARILNQKNMKLKFRVFGRLDNQSPRSVSYDVIQSAVSENLIEYCGETNDVAKEMRRASIFVYPSYYGEGVPKVLLEAAACGLPIVTTDHPGCRDAILDNITGVLVPAKSPADLAFAIEQVLGDKSRLASMRESARILAEQKFSVDEVVSSHIKIYHDILTKNKKHV
jgi:glycosyltransferase involved in cell wall biosynthesis